jgi:hypothetical protein
MRSHLDAPAQEQQSTSQTKAPIASPNYREEAERIVADERAQSEKMPVYEVHQIDTRKYVMLILRDLKVSDLSKRWEMVLSQTSTRLSTERLAARSPSKSCESTK